MNEKIEELLEMNEADNDIISLWSVISDVQYRLLPKDSASLGAATGNTSATIV